MKRRTGKYEQSDVAGTVVQAFVPFPLPPSSPQLVLSGELGVLLANAEEQLRLLKLAGEMVPSVEWFIYAFVRKEAVLSAQIEGTQATLMDLLVVEATGEKVDSPDVADISGYVDALTWAWDEPDRPTGLPLSIRMLSKVHRRLLEGTRGSHSRPGEVRKSQNWIGGRSPGGAAFVPPPVSRLTELLSDLENAIHDDSDLPALVRAGLLHVQFETIHPYLDGNGRLGRLFITLLLKHWKLLSDPLLYLSIYFKTHRAEYYRLLNAVRSDGDWEGWLAFFLEGVATVAAEASTTAIALHTVMRDGRERLLGRDDATVLALRLFEMLPRNPIQTVNRAINLLGCSRPAAGKSLRVLEAAGILVPRDNRKKNRSLEFGEYLNVLRQGTELPG